MNTMQFKNNDLAVDAHELVKIFGDNKAVDGVNLQIPTGMIYGVLGPNGAGKTTTISMLATLLRPDAGSAKIFGYDVVSEPNIVRQLIGVTGQYASVDETLSATENLIIFARLLGFDRATARKKAESLLEEFGLTEAANRSLKNFSGGMRRRLDLAASLIAQPPLIFLDEPTTGLDPRTRAQMWETIRRLVKTGSTVVLTTQYLDEADQLADRIAVIDHGKVIAEGTTNELKSSIGNSTLQIHLENNNDGKAAHDIVHKVLGAEVRLIEPATIVAPLSNPDLVTDLLIALRTAHIRVQEVSVQKPTLDEVFLTLTGNHDSEVESEKGEPAYAAA